MKIINFESVTKFENKISEFFGSPYAVAVDSCTHGVELCLRMTQTNCIIVPKRTYISIPLLSYKMGIELLWSDEKWENYYALNTGNRKIIDAAVLWEKNSYIPDSFMCLSFQYQKHLNLGRGGMILCDNKKDAEKLKKMSYDGRLPNVPWRDQNIDTIGYHYYMTPETAQLGIEKLEEAIKNKPKKWVYDDWPDVSKMSVFIDPYLQTK
jgi:dTDP-4-amino-4,6-dideoxygalactose transaminase